MYGPLAGTPSSIPAFSSAVVASWGREVRTMEAERGRGSEGAEVVFGSSGIVAVAVDVGVGETEGLVVGSMVGDGG